MLNLMGEEIFTILRCYIISGCEDIIADNITTENLLSILNWSSEAHGSKWVLRQALHFLREEFLQIMNSPVLFDLTKDHLIEALSSDFLQVRYYNAP